MKKIKAEIVLPGDKSISHRALMIGSISKGVTCIDNFLVSEDSLSTLSCLRNLGCDISLDGNKVKVYGNGLYSYKKYDGVLDSGNSGTTIRLLSGILSGQEFLSVISGDLSLRKRPMRRIITPLKKMGAFITGEGGDNYAPLKIKGGNLSPICYNMEVNSAQVKSSILLAGLYSSGETMVIEDIKTRDHTERMIKYFGGNISIENKTIKVKRSELYGSDLIVPGDISSGSFFMALVVKEEGSELTIRNVGLNERRTGILDVLREIGLEVKIFNLRKDSFEDVGDITIKNVGPLKPINLGGEIIPRIIDEIPIICVIASFINGESTIKDIEELKYKESNRIFSIVEEFKKLNIDICEIEGGIKIKGGRKIKGSKVYSHNDHRIAMSLNILSYISGENISIVNEECIDISFPSFHFVLRSIIK